VARQVPEGTVPQLEVSAFHVAEPRHTVVDEQEVIETAMRTIATAIERRNPDVDTTASFPIRRRDSARVTAGVERRVSTMPLALSS
jgi:hypothetical protein